MNGSLRWTVEQMRAIIAEYEAAPHGTKAMVLQDHGLKFGGFLTGSCQVVTYSVG